jgi:hypothetical protein
MTVLRDLGRISAAVRQEQKGTWMKSLSPTRSSRARLAAAAVAVLAVAALAPTLASGATSGTPPPPGATVDVLKIAGGFTKGNLLHFQNPTTTVHTGDYLEIDNTTNPHQVGPHTFSLVTKNSIPKTKHARKVCFTKGHICKEIAKGLGVKGNGPPTKNPSEAGLPGWDTEGTKSTVGDTWFTGNKPNSSFVQIVSATPGTTLYYMCAVHPFMHGKVTVQAPGT